MRYPVVMLCGSTQFKDEFLQVEKDLTLQGYIVLTTGLYDYSGENEVCANTEESTLTQTKLMLDEMHLQKIDMSDEIFVINPRDCIGAITRREIDYAFANGKRVRFLEDEKGEHYRFPGNQETHVQAIINNISFPTTIDELRHYWSELGGFDVEDIIWEDPTEWTVPKWLIKEDIVFFFHAKTAIQRIRRLETALKNQKDQLQDYEELMDGLQYARELYDKYGGKIYAIGRVWDKPFFYGEERDVQLHWHGNIFAKIGNIWILENPVSIDEFSDFIRVSRQGAITPILGEDFDKLRTVIAQKNILPAYLQLCEATPYPLREINDQNWLSLSQRYRRQFFLEDQFRRFYVDYLLKQLGDQKTFYRECPCHKQDRPVAFADNGFWLNGKICFVEVKLNIEAEANFAGQLKKYSFVEAANLTKDRMVYMDDILQEYVLFIDTTIIGIYDAINDRLKTIEDLDEIRTEEDIIILKEKIKRELIVN